MRQHEDQARLHIHNGRETGKPRGCRVRSHLQTLAILRDSAYPAVVVLVDGRHSQGDVGGNWRRDTRREDSRRDQTEETHGTLQRKAVSTGEVLAFYSTCPPSSPAARGQFVTV